LVRRLPVVAIALLAVPLAAQGPDPAKVEMTVEKVADSVYMIKGAGGNIGVSIGPDGVLIVDDQFASLVPKIEAAIAGITDKKVRFVLNTHWHFDHTGGNAALSDDATIIAHDNVRRRMAEGHPSIAGRPVPPAPAEALPVITFDDSLTVHVNGEDIRALHYAHGHTDGDSIIFFPKANVVHMGDTFVTYGLPFVDVGSGGRLRGLIENVEKAMSVVPDDVKVIPGHGSLSAKADVKKFTDMLRDCVSLVESAMKEGRTLEQMKADNVLAKYDALGQGFVKTANFIELIHNELKGEPNRTTQSSRRHH
jgi:glyoxylase-like metal-dependent hydrolase (beta-lactamase superfamily II)